MDVDWPLTAFLLVLAFFHLSEALLAARYHPGEAGWGSFLLSAPYALAMCCGLAEYGLERWLWPALKSGATLPAIGLALVVVGEAIRKTAIVTAGSSFTHVIAEVRRPGHRLVTRGIYAVERHPAYLGWCLWAVGTQLLLANPACSVAFAVVSWRFVAARIREEERLLARFFPDDYPRYRRTVRSWIPFIEQRRSRPPG